MKLQIDTQVKTITVEESINLGELYQLLNEMFPDFVWKDYLLIPKVIENWINPITIPWQPQPWIVPYVPQSPYPGATWWNQPYIVSNDTVMYSSDTIPQSTYNIIVDKK
jgi:hypothetical protein